MIRRLLAPLALSLLLPLTAQAAEPECELDRPVVFAGLDWTSNAFHTAVASFIVEHGYGCEVDTIPGSTIPLLNGMARGDIDITMEVWRENFSELWYDAVDKGQVQAVGVNFPDAIQGWFVPKYLVEGEDAKAPGLTKVSDLPDHKMVFRDPEEPNKGRFYNCIAGWGCETVNSKKFIAYGLEEHFTNFRPGTGAALAAAIESNIRRQRPILFYYWGPTWLLGKVGDQVVMLEEPDYDPEIWERLKTVENPTEATAYPVIQVVVGVNSEFAAAAPQLVEFLDSYQTDSALISKMLAYMQDTNGSAEDAAQHFLTTQEALWQEWVAPEVAERVKAAL